jgi:class 3 adenylate cyclase
MGEGPPLVHLPNFPFSHIQLEWQLPEWRNWYEQLAKRRTLVRYDCRGSGLSDREVTDFSLDALVLDLEALVDRLDLPEFTVFGLLSTGPAAIAYAARHPERVAHLVLWCTYGRGADYYQSPQVQALRALRDKDWVTYTETTAHAYLGWAASEEAHRFAAYMRECITPEAVQAAWQAQSEFDAMALLPQVRSPTLVLHRRQFSVLDVSIAQGLASKIPNARLAVLEGETPAPWVDVSAVLAAIGEFLGDREEPGEETEPRAAGAVHTVLFTDIESSTAVTQRLGDAKAQELVRTHNTIVRDALKGCGGSEIKHTGDGIMASFPSASGALECAVAIQRSVEAQGVGAHGRAPLRVRIGLNAGEPVAEEDDLFGASVQLAKRVCDHADPGQIVVADVVRQLATGKGFLFSDLGDVVPKGFEDPVKLWEVRWQEDD